MVAVDDNDQNRGNLIQETDMKKERFVETEGHGLGRCRYLGRLGFAVQAFMTAIMLNL
jgi:hypothetical protein